MTEAPPAIGTLLIDVKSLQYTFVASTAMPYSLGTPVARVVVVLPSENTTAPVWSKYTPDASAATTVGGTLVATYSVGPEVPLTGRR